MALCLLPFCCGRGGPFARGLAARLHLERALDDLLEHRAGLAPLAPGRFETQISGLSVRRGCRRSRRSLLTLFGANSAMSTSPAQSSLCLIRSHEPSSRARRIAAAGPHQHPRAFQLVAVERELQVPLLQRRVHVVGLRRPGALVPQHDDAGAVARGMTPSNVPYSIGWSSTIIARRLVFGSSDGPSAPPTRAARPCIRAGSRSADGWRDVSARRRTAPSKAPSSPARSRRPSRRLRLRRRVKFRFCLYFLENQFRLRSAPEPHPPSRHLPDLLASLHFAHQLFDRLDEQEEQDPATIAKRPTAPKRLGSAKDS